MNDVERNGLTPAEEDPVVHGRLATLPRFAPAGPFEQRVLSRVWRPLPPLARQARARLDEWVDSGRVWLAVGGLAAGSLIPLGILVGLGVSFRDAVVSFGGRMLGDALPSVWSGVTAQIGEWLAGGREALAAALPGSGATAATTTATVLVLLICAWGLYRTMNRRGAGGVANHVAR